MRAPLYLLGLWLAVSSCSRPHAPEPAGTSATAAPASATQAPQTDVYSLSVRSLEGAPIALSQYRRQVTLIVNVASECGYTPQYAGLQRIHAKYKPRGFAVLGFPSNDFGRQEPGSPEEIRAFCSSKYRVDFPMFQKVQTKSGPDQSEVYALLERASGVLPSWNFGKYLVNRSGKVVKFFPSKVDPESPELIAAIEAALAST